MHNFSDDEVHQALSDQLERLTGKATFTVVEFGEDTATIFEVSRDEHGTPSAVHWKYAYVGGVLRVEEPDHWSAAMANPERFYQHVAPKLIVRTPDQLPSGLWDLLPSPPEVKVYECLASLRDLLRGAMKESPLVLDYELAVLTHVPTGHDSPPRLVLSGHALFHRGETQGRQVRVPVNIEPTDDEGTAIAVVTREPRPDLPRHAQRLRPLQVKAAVLRPGTYVLNAVLTRPGHVRFEGLPVSLGDCGRSWDELCSLVPAQLTAQPPVHLVCLVETCGSDDQLQQRIYRLEELITRAQTGPAPVRVSVVAYGAHGVAWRVADRRPQIRDWAVPGPRAVSALRGLVSRRVDEREYQRAAQLECALKVVRERLMPADGRPVIVAAGGRPPHPHELDTRDQLIPCPDFVNGMNELTRLLALPGITFGAFRDPRFRGQLWDRLGKHAAAPVDDAVDMESFAVDLGLCAAAQTVPFPVI